MAQALGRPLPATALHRLSTAREMAHTLELPGVTTGSPLPLEHYRAMLAAIAGGRVPPLRPGSLITAVNTRGSKPPLFWCFNKPSPSMAARAQALGPEQPLYGLYSGSDQLPAEPAVLRMVAEHYAEELAAIRLERRGRRRGSDKKRGRRNKCKSEVGHVSPPQSCRGGRVPTIFLAAAISPCWTSPLGMAMIRT